MRIDIAGPQQELRCEVASFVAVAFETRIAEPPHARLGNQTKRRIDVETAAGNRPLERRNQSQVDVTEGRTPVRQTRHATGARDQQTGVAGGEVDEQRC